MKVRTIVVCLISISIMSLFFLVLGNEMKSNKEKTFRIKAELLYDPIQYEGPDKYLIVFSDTELISGGDYKDVAALSSEGRILTTIPKNERIEKGTEIKIEVKENFKVSKVYPFVIPSEYVKEVNFGK